VSVQARLWIAGHVRRQTVLSLVLLLILFCSLVYGVADVVRGIERGFLWPLVLLGLPLGWLLASSKLRGWQATFLSLIAGAVPLVLYVGQLGNSVAALVTESAQSIWQAIWQNTWPDAAPIRAAWLELSSGVDALLTRLYTWILDLANGQPVFDPVPIALLWGLALWGAAVWAGWAVRRQVRTVWAVAPAIGLLAVTLAYVGGPAWYLLPMLASTLVLAALVEHDVRRQRWEQSGLRYPRRLRSNTLWLALGLSLGLVVAAAITPSVSVARLVELARSLTEVQPAEEEVASSLGLEAQPAPGAAQLTILDARRSIGLPTRHLIGSGPELSERVVMVINIESTPVEALTEVAGGPDPRYYWRSLTYDRYTDRGWSAEYAGRVRYKAGEAAIPAFAPHRQSLRQEVRWVVDRDELLYVAGALVTADRDFRVAWRMQPGEEGPGDAYGALIEAGTYRADSLVPVVGEAELRSAGQDYPAWVVERYLALPDSVPDRVLALARDLTAIEATPYDRALAIERYLRRFPYTLDLPSPPTDRDLVDYFLFDLQRGYCDYYATAMVVLARAAGLPARLVTGYAPGTYDEAEARYLVTEAEAHTWTEVFFSGYGWIEFEPTAGRPALERPVAAPLEVPAEPEARLEPITAHRVRIRWALWLGIGGGLLVLALGGAGVWLLVDGWRLRQLPPRAAVIRLYGRLYRYGRWLGIFPKQGVTPREFAAILAQRLRNLEETRSWGKVLSPAPGEIRWLTHLCTLALYSLHRPQAKDQKLAIQIWSRLRRRLWLARLLAWAPW
jgi:transglutaminase-like putative cysteine protease